MEFIKEEEEIINQEYKSKNSEIQIYLDDLKTIILNSNSNLEGNCFYHHQSLNLYPDLYSKQLNLFWCGKKATTHICEIGFNAGHSTMLMLLGRDTSTIKFTIFDIGHHKYTKPSLEYIKSKFEYVNFDYIEGDSTSIMPVWINNNNDSIGIYDIVHVDGGHSEHCIKNDMINADILLKVNGILIIDDTNHDVINNNVDLYISTKNYIEVKLFQSYGYPHRIIKKIK